MATPAPGVDADWGPARLRPPDWAIALAVGTFQAGVTIAVAQHQTPRRSLDALAVVLLLAGPAALLGRSGHPVAVLAGAFAPTLAYATLGYPGGPIYVALIVALFTTVMAGRHVAAWAALVAGWAAFLWLPELAGHGPAPPPAGVAGLAAWLLVLGTAAEVARARRDRAVELRRARRAEAERLAGEERLRIAHDLHDVVAHTISLINVQAGVALHLLDREPEEARTALTAIRTASHEALGELRSILEVLRRDGDAAPLTPAPSLSDVDRLVERTLAAGLPVRLEVEGRRDGLPPGVDAAAFRIVQEALTNVVRHAGPARATVRVVYGAEDLVVEVDDDGHGPPARRSGEGRGLAGMRERVAALGGRLVAGPGPNGGFRVRAWLPFEHAPR